MSDLHLDDIVAAVLAERPDSRLEGIFHTPLGDVSVVEYRQEIFRDLENSQTREAVLNFIDGTQLMKSQRRRAEAMGHPLQRQGWFICAVQTFCETITLFRDRLAVAVLASKGLKGFAQYLSEYVESQTFQNLVRDSESAQSELRKTRYTVHIQDQRVRVEEYCGQSNYSEGVVATFARFAAEANKDYRVPIQDYPDMDCIEEQILQRVAGLFPTVFALLDEFCRSNECFVEPTITRFGDEIPFYLYYLDFISKFTNAGLAFTYPEVTSEPGVLSADDAFDLALAEKSVGNDQLLVCNDFHLSDHERVIIVTGPNQAGKTTLARSIGQCVYLASLGCPIPARRAKLSLPDQMHTHFERQEDVSAMLGKLEEELIRMRDILSRATAKSIIVMNESFSSTTMRDASLIATSIINRIIKLECTAVYVTFLDELSGLNPSCASMVGDVAQEDPTRRTFRFTRRPADGLAYAGSLAKKYGLSRETLHRRICR